MDGALNRILTTPESMVLFQAVNIGIQCDITMDGRTFRGSGNTVDAALLAAADAGIRAVTGEV